MGQIASRAEGLELVTHIATGDNVWLERFLHEAYSHRRVRGEWFRLTDDDVVQFIGIGSADTIDDLPSAVVAQRVLNEAHGFQWGEHDPDAVHPGSDKAKRMIGIPTPMADALEVFAKSRYSTLTNTVRVAVLEYMKVKGIPLPEQPNT